MARNSRRSVRIVRAHTSISSMRGSLYCSIVCRQIASLAREAPRSGCAAAAVWLRRRCHHFGRGTRAASSPSSNERHPQAPREALSRARAAPACRAVVRRESIRLGMRHRRSPAARSPRTLMPFVGSFVPSRQPPGSAAATRLMSAFPPATERTPRHRRAPEPRCFPAAARPDHPSGRMLARSAAPDSPPPRISLASALPPRTGPARAR